MSLEDEMASVLSEEFEDASFPVTSQMQLVPALSNGPATKFEVGDGEVSVTAMELASTLGPHQDFPYEDLDELVDDAVDAMKEEDIL